jgi:hypothetical protein
VATTAIERRVAQLEETAGGGECPRCGWGGSGPGDDNRPYELRWIDPGGSDDREEFCEECGRQLVYVLTWGDEA